MIFNVKNNQLSVGHDKEMKIIRYQHNSSRLIKVSPAKCLFLDCSLLKIFGSLYIYKKKN